MPVVHAYRAVSARYKISTIKPLARVAKRSKIFTNSIGVFCITHFFTSLFKK